MDFLQDYLSLIDIGIFVYFVFKQWALNRVFRTRHMPVKPFLTALLSLLAWGVYLLVLQEYTRTELMFPIKGAVQLPQFALLFVITDAISTILALSLFRLRIGRAFFSKTYAYYLFDLVRLVFLFVVFSNLLQYLWYDSFNHELWVDNTCFEKQLEIDIAHYYFEHGEVPTTLQQFTRYEMNPASNSPLQITQASPTGLVITDQLGNQLITPTDLVGLNQFARQPEDYWSQVERFNQTVCDGTLQITGS